MHAIARFVGLDLRSMRPNAKFLIIPAGIVVVANLVASAVLLSPYLLIPAMSSLAVLNTPSHLFGNDERGRLDTLYAALGIRRQHVVLGRYATCLLLLIAFTVAGTLVAPVAALAFDAEFEWAVAAAVAVASVTLIGMLLATQLPAYFATGPGPIRIVATIAPGIIMAGIFLAWAFPPVRTGLPSWLDDANPARLTVAAIAAIAALSILGLASTTLSARLYARRDL
jgi:ABC-2 family transporter protein